MKIISELTNQEYKTVEECLSAERDFLNKKRKEEEAAKRKEEERAKLFEEIKEARVRFYQLMNEYTERFGPFVTGDSDKTFTIHKVPSNEGLVNIITEILGNVNDF